MRLRTINKLRVILCCALFLTLFLTIVPAVMSLELSIKDVEQVAIQNDPIIIKLQAKSAAYMEEADAEAQLPDPRMKFGAVNIPIKSFDFKQESMTQIVVGVQQAFPPSGMRAQKREKKLLQAEVQRAEYTNRALHVLRNLRKSWMEVYYYNQAISVIDESKEVFAQLVKITQYQYRAGRGQQQDVVRAQLELSLLEDRWVTLHQMKETNVAELERWAGASVKKHTLSLLFPELPGLPPLEAMQENIEFHPAMASQKAQMGAARKNVAIVKESYGPTWMVDLSYGLRLGENVVNNVAMKRSDFMSAMVSVDLPFFTEKRQDKRLNARGHELNAASDSIEAKRRELRRTLDASYANWFRLGQRLEFYKSTVLPESSQYAEASRKAYQSHVSDFSELIRARLRQLESNLQTLRIRVDRAKYHYDLQYIVGDES